MKLLYIRQRAGLGDIIFLQKLAIYLVDVGYTIIWPVIKEYEYIKEYIQHPNISFISLDSLNEQETELFKSNFVIKNEEYEYIPIDILCHQTGDCIDVMHSKYRYFNFECTNWQNSINFIRYHEREQKCRDFFNLKKDEPFIYVNRLFASPPNSITVEYSVNTNYKIIENKTEYMDMFRVFDFSWILENAKEIHTIETSLCYLVECLNTTDELYVYPRLLSKNNKQYLDYKYIQNIYRKKWKYMEI